MNYTAVPNLSSSASQSGLPHILSLFLGKRNTFPGSWNFSPEPPTDLFPKELSQTFRSFWQQLSPLEQMIFLRRYRDLDTTAEISAGLGVSPRRVKTMLHRMGSKLRSDLETADFT